MPVVDLSTRDCLRDPILVVVIQTPVTAHTLMQVRGHIRLRKISNTPIRAISMGKEETSSQTLSSVVAVHSNTNSMVIAPNNINNTAIHSSTNNMAMHNHLSNTTLNLLNTTGAVIQLHPEEDIVVVDVATAVVVVDIAVEAEAEGIAAVVVEADMAEAGDAKT